MNHLSLLIGVALLIGAMPVAGQTSTGEVPDASTQTAGNTTPAESRWTIHFQATSIGQHHGSFHSLYEGENSLPPHPENRVSLTATIFLGLRVNRHVELVVNPEVAGGRGFGMVTRIEGFNNGEIPRVSSATPTLYAARVFVRTVWALGPETASVEDGANQIAERVPVERLTTITGKFAVTDYFDSNTYSHDPRKSIHELGLDVQRRLGLFRRHARLHHGDHGRVDDEELVAAGSGRDGTDHRQRPGVRYTGREEPWRYGRVGAPLHAEGAFRGGRYPRLRQP